MKFVALLTFLFSCFFVSNKITAQTSPNRYWVEFTDKDNSPFSLDNPTEFLSLKAIEKRKKFDISLEFNDLPVNPSYINEVLDINDFQLINKSKWFNAITIQVMDSTFIEQIEALPFVAQVKSSVQYKQVYNEDKTGSTNSIETISDYGKSFRQIRIHNGQLLHELGFRGAGMDIAVFDAGFISVDQVEAFRHLREEGRIVETKDFTDGAESVYSFSGHGRSVLSIIGGYEKDSLIGTAYQANFYLFVTEESSFENIIEEDNWVAAAEYADSIGIDVINTSLGYSLFDDSTQNHTYADLNGLTTRISIATNIAASKGIIPVTSAGNSGNSSWHYITAPADCIDCLTVGAVDTLGVATSFSSFGPSYDGRVKPDVTSVGLQTIVARGDGTYSGCAGTSYSSPVITGLVACLWQAFPDKSNFEIMKVIRESSHLYTNPNDSLGYGIPDFWLAYKTLGDFDNTDNDMGVNIYPNVFTDHLILSLNSNSKNREVYLSLYNPNGALAWKNEPYLFEGEETILKRFDSELIDKLVKGKYFLKIEYDGKSIVRRIEKI